MQLTGLPMMFFFLTIVYPPTCGPSIVLTGPYLDDSHLRTNKSNLNLQFVRACIPVTECSVRRADCQSYQNGR